MKALFQPLTEKVSDKTQILSPTSFHKPDCSPQQAMEVLNITIHLFLGCRTKKNNIQYLAVHP